MYVGVMDSGLYKMFPFPCGAQMSESVPEMPDALVLRHHSSIWVIWKQSSICLSSITHREESATRKGELRIQVCLFSFLTVWCRVAVPNWLDIG